MTTTEPSDLLDQARERIAERRALLAAGSELPWRSRPARTGPIVYSGKAFVAAVEERADDALIVAAVNAFAPSLDLIESVLDRHAPDPEPMELMLHMDEDCPTGQCEDGDGHSVIVCKGCYPAWDGMEAHSVWPCTDARAALVALGVLDG